MSPNYHAFYATGEYQSCICTKDSVLSTIFPTNEAGLNQSKIFNSDRNMFQAR